MKIDDRTPWFLRRSYTVCGLPVAGYEIAYAVLTGGCMLLTLLFLLRPFGRAIVGWGWLG